jgi:hypothetical protein
LKDGKNEAAVFAGSEESTFCLPEMQTESCELKMECSEPDPDVMIVQPVGTEEDADLVSLCSTLDDAVNRIKRKHQQEDDKSLVLAPSGILDGYRRNVNGNRSSRRKPLKARQHIKADVANVASSPLEDLSNGFNSVIENAANSSPQGQVENIDDAKSPTDISTLDASMSLCTDASQLLASMGISMAGLTAVPAIIQPIAVVNEVATQDSTPETGSLLSSTSMGSDAFQQLPVEMQNFVTSVSVLHTLTYHCHSRVSVEHVAHTHTRVCGFISLGSYSKSRVCFLLDYKGSNQVIYSWLSRLLGMRCPLSQRRRPLASLAHALEGHSGSTQVSRSGAMFRDRRSVEGDLPVL